MTVVVFIRVRSVTLCFGFALARIVDLSLAGLERPQVCADDVQQK